MDYSPCNGLTITEEVLLLKPLVTKICQEKMQNCITSHAVSVRRIVTKPHCYCAVCRHGWFGGACVSAGRLAYLCFLSHFVCFGFAPDYLIEKVGTVVGFIKRLNVLGHTKPNTHEFSFCVQCIVVSKICVYVLLQQAPSSRLPRIVCKIQNSLVE